MILKQSSRKHLFIMNNEHLFLSFLLFFTIQFSMAQYEGYSLARWENQLKN